MRVLLLGGTGNLGRRLIPALLHHGHSVTAYVRSVDKLRGLTPPEIFEKISTYRGDALDSPAVEDALRQHNCDAVMNTAGDFVFAWEQVLGKIAASVSSAAIRVGKERGRPLRAWFIGGMTSLRYPNSADYSIQDYVPAPHHRGTELVMKATNTSDLAWSLLCVAWMLPRAGSDLVMSSQQHHNLVVAVGAPPDWQDSWVRWVPLVGGYLHIILNVSSYTTRLEDVADLLAGDFEKSSSSPLIGKLVGMKERSRVKTLRSAVP